MAGKSRNPWWSIEDAEHAASEMLGLVANLEIFQNGRVYDLLRWGSMYNNRDMLSMSVSSADPYLPSMPQQILNTTRAIVDTVVAKHVEAETKATFETDDGDFEAHKKAEDMDKFVFGESDRLSIYEKQELAVRDACWAGDGWIKFYAKDGQVMAERTLPLEMLMDEASAMSAPPRELYQRRYLSRALVLDMFPDKAEEIDRLQTEQPPYLWPGTDADMVKLVEAWHLPSKRDGKDGRHIIACGSLVLNPDDTEWTYTEFPFARMPWSPAIMGAYSISLVEELAPLQLELNKMMRRIQHSLHLMSVPRIWQSAATKVSPEYDNLIGNVYKFSGPKPEIDVAPSVNPELYAQADRIRERMYEQARISPIESRGQMPSRMDSRPGLREYQEIADRAHAWQSKNWERLSMSCARQIIRVAREIVEEHGTYKAFGRAKGFIEQIDWKDIDLENDRFLMRPQPTSLLPSTPTGKRMVIGDLMDKGMFTDPADAWDMLAGMPDVDAVIGRKTAGKKLVEKQISSIVRKQKFMAPDQVQDPLFAKKFAQETLLLLLTKDNVPRKVIELLEDYMFACDALDQLANPPQPAAPAGGVPPPGVMPNVPGSVPQPGPGGPVPVLQPGGPGPVGVGGSSR